MSDEERDSAWRRWAGCTTMPGIVHAAFIDGWRLGREAMAPGPAVGAGHDPTPRAEFESLLLALHALEVAGEFESNEADTIRSAMEAPWGRLTAEERADMRKLAASLLKASFDFLGGDAA